jgi:hypothetical protein
MQVVGPLPYDQTIYATRFHRGCITTEAPTHECIDCFVLLLGQPLDEVDTDALTTELASANNDWVHVLGRNSESLHDAVDEMSVRLGRQRAVGDGFPMTSWHDDLVTIDEMADFIALGGHGGAAALIVIVIGDEFAFSSALDALERHRVQKMAEYGT